MKGGIKIPNPLPMQELGIEQYPLPDVVVLPIFDETPLVSVGDNVVVGQALSSGTVVMHATISGKVTNIDFEHIPHPSNLKVKCITIKGDGKDTWIDIQKPASFLAKERDRLIYELAHSGIIGLGGAGFSTSTKLQNTLNCHTIIVNGCECEPGVEADNALMIEHGQSILRGIDILLHITQACRVIIAIEDDKSLAYQSLKELNTNAKIVVQQVPTIYGSGGEKSLIKELLNTDIKSGKFASNYGILVQNIATIKAIADFIIDGIPLIERVVTIATNNPPKNYLMRIGTMISSLSSVDIRVGGLMMGIDLPHNSYPILKTTNALFKQQQKPKEVYECIRCGDCATVCPAELLPQQIYWFAKSENIDKCVEYGLTDCTLCRACDEVCGSNIPLSTYFHVSKLKHKELLAEQKAAQLSKERFNFREYRLARNKAEREEIMAKKRAEIKTKQEALKKETLKKEQGESDATR